MAGKKSNSTFEVSDDFLAATEGEQDKAVRAFLAANPKARIVPNEVGQSAPFLRRQGGKRFNISERINQGGVAKEILTFARANGGGERDVAAHLAGGFSRASKFYGQSIITLYTT
jgi:hypothetical protein|tara:strand:- start:64 stop:408 length:345 start_codon:yes stop_codon:yes gene_type:complete